MREFAFTRPERAEEAIKLVAVSDAAYLAGGTNLVDLMKLGVTRPGLLVDITALGLDFVTELPDGGLRIGAGTRNSDLAASPLVRSRYPVLAQAILAGASGQLRNQATVGGNLLQRTRCTYFQDLSKPCNKRRPGSGCPARTGEHHNLAIIGASEHCIATHPSDMAVALSALGAVIQVQESAGQREIPLADFYLLPGDRPDRETVLPPGALITAVDLPPLPLARRSAYRKVRERASYAFAIGSIAAALDVAGGTVRDVRLSFGALAPMPWRARLAEEALRGQTASPEAFRDAAARELAAARPLPDNAYKISVITAAAVQTLCDLSGGNAVSTTTLPVSVGSASPRLDGVTKVTGEARYAAEFRMAGRAYGCIAQSAIARGRILSINTDEVRRCPGVIDVLTHASAPRLHQVAETQAWLLQDDRVHYHGQVVALVVAETLEQAQAAAEQLHVEYDVEPHDVVLRADHPDSYVPDHVNPNFPSETHTGDVDAAFGQAAFAVDQWYATPAEHNNPMEPHASTAYWDDGRLIVHDSNQGSGRIQAVLAALFGLDAADVQVIAEYVGGGFGSKAAIRPPVVLAAIASQVAGRAVTVAVTRREMFSIVGCRTPTLQHVRLGADESGRLTSVDHLCYEQTSQIFEFAEETAVLARIMYATPSVRTGHRLVRLDVPTPRWMRAPGFGPGSFGLESAMDELAHVSGIDPVELRIRNDTDHEADGGAPFTSRSYAECLREGSRRFGWSSRDPQPGVRRDGRWLLGTGMASCAYPAGTGPSTATAIARPDGTFIVEIGASDIGTGARTVLTQISADALGVSPERIQLRVGDSRSGPAVPAALSMGTASWGWAALKACRQLAAKLDGTPVTEVAVRADTTEDLKAQDKLSRYSFGAQFVQVRVDTATGEVRADRMVGVFAAGRIVNPVTARSQLIGGMTMGLGMALHEAGIMDPQFGDYANNDLSQYHIPAHADVPAIEVGWIDEQDSQVNPLGVKGIGELGVVGTAAAIANAVWHATGIRYRTLPLTPPRVLQGTAG